MYIVRVCTISVYQYMYQLTYFFPFNKTLDSIPSPLLNLYGATSFLVSQPKNNHIGIIFQLIIIIILLVVIITILVLITTLVEPPVK